MLFGKASDIEKVDAFLAPMNNSKTAKLPETIKEAREKAAAKKKPKAKAKSASRKASAKSKARDRGGEPDVDQNAGKRGSEDLEIEQFAVEMVDVHGVTRFTLFGDDVLNAVNYTLEKVNPKNHRKDYILRALNLATLFALDGSLDKAGLPKYTAWSRVRQYIKSVLNRAHALHARVSDPDRPLGVGHSEKDHEFEQDGGEQEDHDEADEVEIYKHLGEVLKSFSDKIFSAFMDGNFQDYVAGSDDEEEDMDDDSGVPPTPLVADVLDAHPGCKLVVNKVKKGAKTFLSTLKNPGPDDEILTGAMMEVIKGVNAVFDPVFVDVVIALITASTKASCEFGDLHSTLGTVPSITAAARKSVKLVVRAFGAKSSNAVNFLLHHTASWFSLGLSLAFPLFHRCCYLFRCHVTCVCFSVYFCVLAQRFAPFDLEFWNQFWARSGLLLSRPSSYG